MNKPTVTIEYCEECMYLQPALEAAHTILTRYADRVGAVILKPGHGGIFRVTADGAVIIEMGDEGLPTAERVAQALGEFLSGRPLPQPLPDTERGGSPFPFREGGFGGEGYLWDKRYRDMAQRPCRQLEPQLSPILLNTALDFRPASPIPHEHEDVRLRSGTWHYQLELLCLKASDHQVQKFQGCRARLRADKRAQFLHARAHDSSSLCLTLPSPCTERVRER